MLDWLQGWYNWPFLLTLFVGLGLSALSFLGFGKDVDVDGGLDGDGSPDLDGDASHHNELGHVHIEALSWLGLGKAPLSVLLQTLLISFGIFGLIVNAVAHDIAGWLGPFAFPVALGVAMMGSVAATRSVAMLFFKLMPPGNATSKKPGEYIGKLGTAATLITRSFGQVTIVEMDDIALINACTDSTVQGDIPRGTEVHLISYDPERYVYRAIPIPDLSER